MTGRQLLNGSHIHFCMLFMQLQCSEKNTPFFYIISSQINQFAQKFHYKYLKTVYLFVMAALCNRAGHYIFVLWFLSFFLA